MLPEGEELGREDGWNEEPQEDETGDGNVGDVLRERDKTTEHETLSNAADSEKYCMDSCVQTDMQHTASAAVHSFTRTLCDREPSGKLHQVYICERLL